MLYKKEGYPEEHELVSCTVTKVLPQCVFVNVNEYSKQGMIHIAEVSPGRIRNIRDYVKEGKVVVCKVLRVSQEKGHIDLSLRRVTESQKREKNEQVKLEMTAEKIIEFLANEQKKKVEDVYKDVTKPVFEDYEYLNDFFMDVVAEESNVTDYIKDKKLAEELDKLIKQRIKVPKVELSGNLLLTSYDPNGVEVIKAAIKKAIDADKRVTIKYVGAGKYSLHLKAPDYKEAEKVLEKVTKTAIDHVNEHNGSGSFVRAD